MSAQNRQAVEGTVEPGTPRVSERITDFIEQLISNETRHKVYVKRIQLDLETPDGPMGLSWEPTLSRTRSTRKGRN